MSVNGIMRTSVSGMNAQANRLSTVSDNIANSNTNGYKRATTEFSTLVLPGGGGEYNSGSVQTQVRNLISQQGGLAFTSSATDVAVSGNGFFIVTDHAGQEFYTRAGSFVTQTDSDLDKTYLVNAAGFRLTGERLPDGALETIDLPLGQIVVAPTTQGALSYNFPVNATKLNEPPAVGELPPSSNDPASVVQEKNSLVVYDNVGKEIILDVYSTKTADNTWEVAIYNRAQAAPGGGFPYASVSGEPLLQASTSIVFDPTTGRPAATPAPLSIAVENGRTVAFDLSSVTEFAADFQPNLSADGSKASVVESFSINETGVLSAVNSDGSLAPIYQLNLARFPSPDNLKPLAGNVYAADPAAGDVDIGVAGSLGFGSIVSGALEQSTVDLASELTSMIESQRGYSANSKVFQTGSEILDVLVNLKR